MRRERVDPRPDWLERVEAQGLTYAVDRPEQEGPAGASGAAFRAYWHEEHAYVLTEAEAEHLEAVTEELHRMSVEAARHLLRRPRLLASLGLPEPLLAELVPLLDESLAAAATSPTLYGRFDLVWDGEGPVSMLEYNADTPAGLVEAAVCQWHWLEDVAPDRDQWNLLHERLVRTWRRIGSGTGAGGVPGGFGAGVPDGKVHLAVGQEEPTEDWATVGYLAETAAEAGLDPVVLTMESVGWHPGRGCFVDADLAEIRTCFKMYPWEWLVTDPFGRHVVERRATTTWVEPLWKMLLSSKTILVALWETYPGHENLLRAEVDGPHGMREYVAKPVFGWEGAGIDVVADDVATSRPAGHTTGQPRIFQEYLPAPRFGGAAPVLGSWVVGGRAAGLGIRESDGPVTDTGARFVPHLLDVPRSTPEQVSGWLDE